MTRRIAAGAAAMVLGAMVSVAGCGAGQTASPPPGAGGGGAAGSVGGASAVGATGGQAIPVPAANNGGPAMGGPCRSAMFPELQAAAKATLPVPTTETAVTQFHGVAAATFQKITGVAADGAALAGAFSSRTATGNPLTASPGGGGTGAWTFTLAGQMARLSIAERGLAGAALALAQSFGPAWAGGTAEYRLDFPAGSLAGSPSLGDYLNQLAAQVAAGKADLTVITGGNAQPAPAQFRAYWGPIQMGALTASGSPAASCGAWSQRMAYDYTGGTGTVAPVAAQMADIGNGGFVGFAGGRFVVESLHAGVDAYTWYAIPGLPVTPA